MLSSEKKIKKVGGSLKSKEAAHASRCVVSEI